MNSKPVTERRTDSVKGFGEEKEGGRHCAFYEAFLKLRSIQDSILAPRNLYFYVK